MNGYRSYMDRQYVSETGHRRLLDLEPPKNAQRKGAKIMALGTLAACAALIAGLSIHALAPSAPGPAADAAPSPAVSAVPTYAADDGGDRAGFEAQGPAEDAELMFPMIAWVGYADVTDDPQLDADLALPDGAFSVALDKEDVQTLFWGADGKPAVEDPKTDPGDFPIMLMNWAGYSITGGATYDGNGDLWELYVQGVKGEDSFTLRAAPGHIPPTCIGESGASVTDVLGVAVSGWYRSYDRDGDGEVEPVCVSQFLANGVGFRFENVGSGGSRAGTDEATDLGGAMTFNSMVVTQLCRADGFYLDPFARNENVPAWAEEQFDSLSQVQSYAGYPRFAPYLPTQGPKGYGGFSAHLSYQQDHYDTLRLCWSRGYDDVAVEIRLSEGDSNDWLLDDLVDVSVPASYDWRLYDGPIRDAVPEEYQQSFYAPVFRAEDMSLEVVKARMTGHDTGGERYRFYVLHENGAVVGYDCAGVGAEYVWGLVEATL